LLKVSIPIVNLSLTNSSPTLDFGAGPATGPTPTNDADVLWGPAPTDAQIFCRGRSLCRPAFEMAKGIIPKSNIEKGSRRKLLKHSSSYYQSLDLASTFINLGDTCITIVPLHRIFSHITVTTKNLHSLMGNEGGSF
jgi:hypothetical protein